MCHSNSFRMVRGWSTPFGSIHLRCNQLSINMDVLFERFCDDDSFGVVNRTVQPVNPENERALQILETTTQFVGDRYESGLLWKYDSSRFPNNRSMAGRRLQSLERRFKINPSLAEKYSAAIKEYINLGHARKLYSEESINGPLLPKLSSRKYGKTSMSGMKTYPRSF